MLSLVPESRTQRNYLLATLINVYGIGLILTAMTLGQRFGVISILRKSIARHLRYVGQMGVGDRMAGDRAL